MSDHQNDSKALVISEEESFDNDWALLDSAAHDLTSGDMVGDPMKFAKIGWQLKKGSEWHRTKELQQFAVDIRSYQHGWIRWWEKRPTHRYIGRVIDSFPLPVRCRMPEPELEGQEGDPWQETHSIVMRDLGAEGELNANGKLYTYTTNSYGGRKAIRYARRAF